MKTARFSRRPMGFTMMELLVVVLLIALLAALAIPLGRQASARSKEIRCVQNLRQIGPIFHSYAIEQGGKVEFLRDGSGKMWFPELRKHAGLSPMEAQRLFECPTLPSSNVDAWHCYGMRLGYMTPQVKDDPGFPIKRDGANAPAFYGFSIAAIADPARFFLMADSSSASGRQTMRIADRKLYSGGGIRLRHQGKANVLFLDGHVESLVAEGLFDLGFLQILDGDMRVLSK